MAAYIQYVEVDVVEYRYVGILHYMVSHYYNSALGHVCNTSSWDYRTHAIAKLASSMCHHFKKKTSLSFFLLFSLEDRTRKLDTTSRPLHCQCHAGLGV